MEITKVGKSFGMYTAKLSFAELEALAAILAGDAGQHQVIADEMRASVNWHLANALPGPGEDPEEFKARKDAADPEGRGSDQVPAEDFEHEAHGGEVATHGGEDDELAAMRRALVKPPTA